MDQGVTFKTRLGYFLGVFGSSVIYGILNTFLIKYYTDITLIAPMVVGTMFFAARIWDAVNDFIMGAIADKTRTRWGKFRPYILIVPLPIALATSLLFAVPDSSPLSRIVYMYVTYIAWGMIFTAIDIPMWALASVETGDPGQRKGLMSTLSLGSLMGGVIPGVMGVGLLTLLGGVNESISYTRMGVLVGFAGSALMFLLFFTSKERVDPAKREKPRIREVIRAFFATREILLFIVFQVFAGMIFALITTIGTYYTQYVLHDINQLTILMLMGGAGIIAGIFAYPYIGGRLDNRTLIICAMAFTCLVSSAYYFAGYGNLYLVYLFTLLPQFGVGIILVAIPVVLGDLSEYVYLKDGVSMEGVIFATKTFCVKLSNGLAALAITALFTFLRYIPNVEQAPEVIAGLFKTVTLLPTLLSFLALLPMLFYRPGDKKLSGLRTESGNR